MKNLDKKTYKHLQNELFHFNQENSPVHGFENVSIIIVNKKRFRNGKKHNVFMQAQPRITSRCRTKSKKQSLITRHSSLPELYKTTRRATNDLPRIKIVPEMNTKLNKYMESPFQSKFIVNVVSEHRFVQRLNPFYYHRQTKLKIYRCELATTVEDGCCCSCNSDAMFEVMKGLYDCYKAKNCDNCNCILCGHLTGDKKKLASKKSKSIMGLSETQRLQKAKDEGLLTPLTGKSAEEKEKILKGLSMKGLPLPEGQTSSEKKLIDKVRTDLGLPKEPESQAEREKLEEASRAGKLWPLEGKTSKEKEKILTDLHNMGIPLPEGRTPSEKSLIAKVAAKSRRPSKATTKSLSHSEQMKRAKAEGLLTALPGKPPEQKEKILKGLAMKGLPLPEGQSPSEKKLIDQVRADLGLPKEPKDKAERNKHEQAARAGLLQPLEGKTPAQKEKILKGLHDLGIPLPEGRTPSEKSLIAKVATSSRHPSKLAATLAPSDQMKRARMEGLLTPLKGKTPEQKEKILKGLANRGLPLPEGQTPSEKKLVEKIRADLGLPKEPKNKAEREKHILAAQAGLLQPLEGKTPAQKKKILKGLHDMGISLPEGRTPSEKSLIAKVTASSRHPSKVASAFVAPSEQMKRAKAAGLLTPLTGKTPEQKEKILKGLAMRGLPLPEAGTPSEKDLIDKVRADLGLPKEPKTKAEREKHELAAKAGLLKPLEGKTPAQKEKILKDLHDMGIRLPVGRTPSEKSLIAKVAAKSRHPSKVASAFIAPSEQMKRAKVEGLLTPLKGKTPEQKEKILKGLAMKGLPLPEAKTPSEKDLIDKVRADLGLPKEPKTKAEREKHELAAQAGLLKPLEGKTPEQKEKILKDLHDMGIRLPVGRTPSEKSLIAKVAAKSRHPSKVASAFIAPSEQMKRAKAEGLLTPLQGKTPEQKEKILKGLAMKGLPLPEAKTPSEKDLIDKVRADLGLPKEPKNKAERDKHELAAQAGLLKPLEGKTPAQKEKILKDLHDMGIRLPTGRTPSEKSLIAKVAARSRHPSKVASAFIAPSEQMKRAKAEGLITPLQGKTPEQKEKILKGLAMKGLPLPEAKTPSEKDLIDKVRADLGLPKEPKTKAEREKHELAAQAGLLKPLEGKTPEQKEKILKDLHDMGIRLPTGRTPSEKSLIAKVAARSRHPSKVASAFIAPSEQMKRAKAEGLITPLQGKTPEQKEKILKGLAMKGLPLPEAKTPSEKDLIDKVRADLGLPKEPKTKAERDKHELAAQAGLLKPLEGKTPEQKEKILKDLHNMGIPLPEGRTPSEKSIIAKVAAKSRHPSKVASGFIAPSEQMKRAKAEGLLTPLQGKTPEQKEKILKGLAMKGLPLPEAKTPSEKDLIDKVRNDLGLPKEPKNKAERDKHELAAQAGLLKPLEGKTPAQKEKILKDLHDMGIPLPDGRTPSEKALIAKVAAKSRHPSKVASAFVAPSEQMKRAKAEGLLTPLTGKTPEQKEKVLKGLAMKGLPLPEAKTPSEKDLIDKVRAELGLPKEPKTKAEREKHELAAQAGLLKPLEGKTPAQKEKILKDLHDMGIPLPEGRTPSEKALVAKVAAKSRHPSKVASAFMAPSEQMKRAKAEGLLTPLKGKTPEQKEKILKGLAMKGLPLPAAQTPSEKDLIDKVRADLGLPKEPKTKAERDKHVLAAQAGLLKPLEGKTPAQKEKILKDLHNMGIPLPEGRTPSEKALIANVAAKSRHPSKVASAFIAPSQQIKRAKAEGLLTPLQGKTPEQKEKILKGLAMKGLPLPEAKTTSEKNLIDKVRADLGLPKEPKTKAERDKHELAAQAGLLKPLEGKTPAQKEKILKDLHNMGIPLPEGRTPSEKALIANVAAKSRHPSKVASAFIAPSEQLKRAKVEGLLTPLKGKTPEQKEKILKGLAMKGLPLPEGQTPSEKHLIDKVRADLGLPEEPKTKAEREKHELAAQAGLLKPLEGKTPAQKEKILKDLHNMGIPLPEGRTPSEKALIANVAAKSRHPSKVASAFIAPSEQMKRAKVEGLLTPLKGKTPEQKEKILKGLAMKGLPLPEAQTPSEKDLIDKVRNDLGLPKEPKTKAERDKHELAAQAGLLKPLEGKTPAQKEKILKDLHNMGIPLPEGRSPSEKALIANVAAKSRHPSKVASAFIAPSEQMKRAKVEGLLTPLKGKTPEQKEKILKGLAMKGLPLPEAKTPSEKDLIDKVRNDLGLPKEPKNKAERDKHELAAQAGLLKPLEGKTPAQKEKILKDLHNMGIPLPEGRSPSEKALIANVAAKSRHPSKVASAFIAPSEQMKRAKVEGLLTPLKGKTSEQKEKILKGLAMKGLPLPEAQTPSEKDLIDKVRADLGLPKEPKTKAERNKHELAAQAGLLKPLEGKSPAQKEKILKDLHNMGIPLPEGRTPSEKALIANVAAKSRHPSKVASAFMAPSEQMKRAKAEGLLTPLKGKTPEQKEKILKGLAMKGLPLPEAKTPSEKDLIDKVRADLGLPKEPKTKAERDKHDLAAQAGLLKPLEGKTPAQKEKILKDLHNMGIPLPEGRTPSEKALIANVIAKSRHPSKVASAFMAPSEQMKRAKAEGLLTPLTGKTPEQKEKVLKGLAMKGLPLPEAKTPSEKDLIDKVRADLGLPKEPKNKAERDKHELAAQAGLLKPLEGKTPAQKEKILKDLHNMGIPLPEGRSPSEKALVAKVAAKSRHPSKVDSAFMAPSEQMKRAKAEGLFTPLKGKTPEQKETILKGLANRGLPLPEGQTPSEKKLIDKVRGDLGLPKEPKNKAERDKHDQAAKAGLLKPLEGKTPAQKEKILKGLHNMGIPLPEGRTPSEKSLIAKIAASSRPPSKVTKVSVAPSEQMRQAKAEGLLTPLTGKTPEQKEKVLKALAMKGLLLPEGQTPSEKDLINKVRADLGLPKEPKNKTERDKQDLAAQAGLLKPLEGKTPAQKEKILKGLHDMGIPLPEGRTPSEKSLIAKVAASSRHPSKVASAFMAPSEQMKRAKAEGLLTPLKGKTPEQKETILKGLAKRGLPLPEGQTPSEKKLIDKVRADLGLPKEPKNKAERDKHDQAAKAGLLKPLEGKTPAQKEKILKDLHNMGIPLPEGRTPSEKSLIAKIAASSRPPSKVTKVSVAPSEQMRQAKAEGLLTPLTGKTPEQKEKILKGLAMKGLPLPEGKTPSEKQLIDKVRADLGLPKEPKNKAERDKHDLAAQAGLLQPLEGKTPEQKEKILRGLHDMGVPLPEGRTPSEKSLIAKVAAKSRHPSKVASAFIAPSEQIKRAKAEGLITPLKGKTPEEKEKILKGLAMKGLPLPEAQTPSEKDLINKVRADLGLPKEPKTKAERDKHELAAQAGLLKPLEGKTPAQKEKILKDLHDMGIPLPEGRTPSEKALVAKVAAKSRHPSKVASAFIAPSEQIKRAKAEGLLTPLKGKTPEQKEKILKGLAMKGLPLPEAKTPSEKDLIDKVRADLGLPKEPKTKAERDRHELAAQAGLLKPLEGKTPTQKEKILKDLHDMGIPLPEGRTPSEKALVAKVAAKSRHPSKVASAFMAPSEQMKRAKAEGLLTPLKGKTPEQKEKILKGLAMKGLPLPEGQSPSEKDLINKVRADLGLPKEPKNRAERDKHERAAQAGLLKPLEGKTPAEKENILKGLHDIGVPLPEGRTPSEKALIAKVAARSRHPSKVASAFLAPSEQMKRAKAEGLLTPLKGKTPEQKEKILQALANRGLPLPEAKTPSEKALIDKVRTDLGLPKEPQTRAERDNHDKAAKAGLLLPLEGKTPAQKEKILQGLHNMGIPLPEGRTPSEKSLIAKVAATSRHPSKVASLAPSEQMRRAKAEGLLTPLKGKTPEQKEKILQALANRGLPLPEAKTPSEKNLINKVRADLGLPKEPSNQAERDKHDLAAQAGLLQPLEGKTPAQKQKILKGLHDMGIPLPEGRSPSEKALIAKVARSSRHPSKVASEFLLPSEQMKRAKVEGLLTPLQGKTPEQKEKILKALANRGLPLPEGQTPSEKQMVDKIRADLGLPKEPKNKAERDKHDKAAKAGLLLPLEGKSPAQKENILKGLHNMGIPLPEGRTPSEKSLIAKVAATSRHPSKVASLAPSEQMRRAKAEGLLTPLKGKTPEQKEKILQALANRGLPLPEAKTPSEKAIINKVRADLGLPKEPTNQAERDKHDLAAQAGLLQPLEGKTPAEKAKILKGLHDMGIPLPEGRSPSEKALIAKVARSSRHPSKVASAFLAPSEQMKRAKAEGLLTPLKGKTPEQKEKILKALANRGLPLPEGQTPSEKQMVDKIRADLGLPKEPKTQAERDKHDQAAKAGFLQPLEGKTPEQKAKILKGLHNMGIPLPEGRTPSEKSLIAKIAASSRPPSKVTKVSVAPSEQIRQAKAEGLLTPLTGKTPEQKEKILKGLAMKGLPLPEGQTPSEKDLINKVRADLGLPKEPKNKAERDKQDLAAQAGLLKPLEGKTPAQKEKILKGLHDMGIPLPEGRTPSEKSLIAKVAASTRHPSKVASAFMAPSEQMKRAKAEGLLTPLKGKTPEQKETILKGLANRGLPLPEGQTPSEKKLIDKVRADLGLPKEPKNKAERDKHDQAAKAGLLKPLEGKTPEQKEKILKGLQDMGIPLPEGRTPSEKSLIAKVAASSRRPSKVSKVSVAPSEQIRQAKAEGLLTPLTGKAPEQKEKILKGLAMKGLPLPEGKTPSEKQLIDKVRADLGLPKEPKNKAERDKHDLAAQAGLLQPLEGKTPEQKEKILRGLHDMGVPLPEGRTPSEKSLIAKIAASTRHPSKVASAFLAPSEQMKRAIVEGLLTPLKGKTPEQKENILQGLAYRGLPLPIGKTSSEKKLIAKVRADLGLPKEPKTKAERDKHDQAAKAGLLKPLEGQTPAQKEKILKGLHDLGIPLPEGRTPSEKSLIAKIAASSRRPSKVTKVSVAPSEQMKRAKAEGLLTPLTGKTPEQKEKILKGLAMKGLPLPEGKTPSEKDLITKVRTDLGLPKEPKSKAEREKHDQASQAGLLQPLEGKTPAQKEKILKGLHDMGITLPEGRTPSEKSLIAKVASSSRHPSKVASAFLAPSEQMKRAKAEGLLTPLKGKTPEQKETILKGLANRGLPLPEGQTPSEKVLIDKVRADLGLPKEPKNKAERDKHDQAAKAGLLKPLEGKTPAQKEKILKGLHELGIPLPEGRTPSEKSLIAKIAASSRRPSKVTKASLSPSEQMKRAKAEGLLTPLTGKTPEQKEKILKGLAMAGLPLPEAKTSSEKNLIDKVRADLGLPKEPQNKAERDQHELAAKAGLLKPLEGKTPAQKEKILKGLHDLGISLPEGRTASEKSLIAKIAATSRHPSAVAVGVGTSAIKKVAAGIGEEVLEIEKTTKCDRACGCDKKKIRFKHSYVKIRVTSPDMSSFCDCPDECIPGVKAGAFIDNEGIKVTVGTAVGIPSFTISQTRHSFAQYGYKSLSVLKHSYSLKESESERFTETSGTCSTESENIYLYGSTYEGRTSQSDRIVECLKRLQSTDDIYSGVTSETKSVASSFASVIVIKSEISLCSSNTSKGFATISSVSLSTSSITSNCTSYSDNQSTGDPLSSSLQDKPTTSDDFIDHPETTEGSGKLQDLETVIPQREYTISRMSATKFNFENSNMRTNKRKSETETEEPVILFNHIPNKLDVTKLMYKIMSNKRFTGASSIFIVVPVSDDDEEQSSSDDLNSMTSIYSSDSGMMQKDSSYVNPNSTLRTSSFTNRNEQVCGKGKKFHLQEISSNDTETMSQNESLNVLRCIDTTNDEIRQIRKPSKIAQMLEKAVHGIGTDTTADRPCWCQSKECSTPFVIQNCCSKDDYAANAMSKYKMPLILQDATSGFRIADMRTPPTVSSRMESSLFTNIITGGCCLRVMRTPSLESFDMPSKVHTRPSRSVGSSQLPHKTLGYCNFPDMSSLSAISSVLHCMVHNRPAPTGVDRSPLVTSDPRTSVTPNEAHDCSQLPVLPTESSGRLCNVPEYSDDHVHLQLADLGRHPDHTELDSNSTRHNRCKKKCTPYGLKQDVLNHETTIPEGVKAVAVPIDKEPKQQRLRARWKAKMLSGYFRKKLGCECKDVKGPVSATDEISSDQPCIQESGGSKMPKDSSRTNNDVCVNTENEAIIIGEMSDQLSKMPENKQCRIKEDYMPYGLKTDVSDQETNTPSISLPQSLLQQDSNEARPTAYASNSKKNTILKTISPEPVERPACVSNPITHENLGGLNLPTSQPLPTRNQHSSWQSKKKQTITKDDTANRQPQPRVRWKSQISSGYFRKKPGCVCDTNEISSHQPCFQEIRDSKMPTESSSTNNCSCEDTENEGNTGEITDQLSEIPDDTHHDRIKKKYTPCGLEPDVSNQETNTPPISHSQSPLQQDSNEAGPANESSNKKATTLKMIPPEANNCFCEDIDNEGITGEGTEIPDDTHHNRMTEKCTTCDLKPDVSNQETNTPTANASNSKKNTTMKTISPEPVDRLACVSDPIAHENLGGLNLPTSQPLPTRNQHSSRSKKKRTITKDDIANRQPQPRVRWKSKISSGYFRKKRDCVCDVDGQDSTTDEISSHQPCFQEIRESKMPIESSSTNSCICEDTQNEGITSGTTEQLSEMPDDAHQNRIKEKCTPLLEPDVSNQETTERLRNPPDSLVQQDPNEVKPTANKRCTKKSSFDETEGAGITKEELPNRQTRPRVNWKSKLSSGYFRRKQSRVCDKEGVGSTLDEISSHQPCFQESWDSKIPIQTSIKNNCPCEDNEGIISDEITDQLTETPEDTSLKVNCGYQEKPKYISGETNCRCQECPEYLTNKLNCACQEKPKDLTGEADRAGLEMLKNISGEINCVCQENPKDLTDEVHCECPEMPKKLTGDVNFGCQGKPKGHLSKCIVKKIKDGKFICKCLTNKAMCNFAKKRKCIKKLSKKRPNTEVTSFKLESQHSVQTMTKVCDDDCPCELNCGWIDTEKHLHSRSELTECTSGFKACKKRKQKNQNRRIEKQSVEIELSFEDAVKYYVGKNLEQFQDLLQPLQAKANAARKDQARLKKKNNKKSKKKNGKINLKDSVENVNIPIKQTCQCPYGPTPPFENTTLTPEDNAKLYPKGMKLAFGGRGTSPVTPGIALKIAGHDGVAQTAGHDVVVQTADSDNIESTGRRGDAETAGRDRVVQTAGHNVATQTPGPADVSESSGSEGFNEAACCDRVVQTEDAGPHVKNIS